MKSPLRGDVFVNNGFPHTPLLSCPNVQYDVHSIMDELKDVWWEGTSREDLNEFPDDAKHLMGYQLHIIQTGEMPDDWKPLKNLGKGITGVYEIRISVDKNIFRTAYVTKFSNVVVVLHCWQKKTQQTAQADKDLIVSRYRSAKEALK